MQLSGAVLFSNCYLAAGAPQSGQDYHCWVELLKNQRHLKGEPDCTLLYVRRQKPKRLETTGLSFNNVCVEF